jgi:hypothetical protein
MQRHKTKRSCGKERSVSDDCHVQEWRAFRRWANSACANDINQRLLHLIETNPIAVALWEEHRDKSTRGAYRRSTFWDGNHRVCVDSVGGVMTQDYFGLYTLRLPEQGRQSL